MTPRWRGIIWVVEDRMGDPLFAWAVYPTRAEARDWRRKVPDKERRDYRIVRYLRAAWRKK